MLDLVWLIPALPLAGFLLLLLFGKRLGEPLAGWLATLMVLGSFVVACIVFAGLVERPGRERFFSQVLFSWIPVGNFQVDAGFLVDPLAMTMVLFVTGIASLIHLYSIGYMHGDEGFPRFFVYLNLFVFSMLMLVLGDNLLVTFLGWEGVGACSYFLISFWFTDRGNASAGKKAFVTNRVGDWGFMVAIFLTFATIGSVRYADVLTAAKTGEVAVVTATAISALLLVGAVGKSAQLPLFVWLPDAMAGPTPVSALIHAATMVTAGVYLLARMNPMLAVASDWVPHLIAWVGAITALFAATVAVAQNDIKRVLAYSTISQLGYLFLAVGVAGYVPAMFHMVTHAFFKALLFLAAGAVIHGMHGEQDMRRYGGLYKYMPVTCGVFIVGWLAISGIFPFAGFWSKDEILAYAWDAGAQGKALWLIGLATALLTAFYMSRQVFLTFFGRYRYADPTPEEINEAWDARIAAARSELAEAEAALEAGRAEQEAARAKVEPAEAALVGARSEVSASETAAAAVPVAQLEAARVAVDTATDKDAKKAAQATLRELEKPGKDLDKARTGVTKAETALTKARDGVTSLEAQIQEVEASVTAARARVAEVEAMAARHRPTVDKVSVAGPPDLAGIEDYLPAAVQHRREHHPHESPAIMLLPLVVLAAGAIGAGALNLPFSDRTKFLERWLEPSLFGNEHHLSLSGVGQAILAVVAVAGAVAAIVVAARVYLRGLGRPAVIEQPVLEHAWYIDETLARIASGPGELAFEGTARFDRQVIDGAVNGVGEVVRVDGSLLRRFQNGYVRSYALGVAVGAIVLIGLFLSRASF
jgi:NADH-quinone oxidoreductase subunit L